MDSVLKIETNYYLNIIYKKTMSANTLYSFQFSLAQVFFQILKHMVGWLSGSVPGQLRLDIRGASRSRVRIPLRSLLIFTNERPCKGSRRSDLCRTNSMVQVTIVNIKTNKENINKVNKINTRKETLYRIDSKQDKTNINKKQN